MRGPSANLDPRYHAFRGDLADVALADRLFAPHYAKPVIRYGSAVSPLLAQPNVDAEVVGQIQPGEEFALLDVTGGWAWGYRTSDHLVGYLRDEDLSAA